MISFPVMYRHKLTFLDHHCCRVKVKTGIGSKNLALIFDYVQADLVLFRLDHNHCIKQIIHLVARSGNTCFRNPIILTMAGC